MVSVDSKSTVDVISISTSTPGIGVYEDSTLIFCSNRAFPDAAMAEGIIETTSPANNHEADDNCDSVPPVGV